MKKLLAIALLCVTQSITGASDWPSWRGHTGLGYTDEKDLRLTWSKKGDGVLWKTLLHGGVQRDQDFTSPGWSCPIVWKDRVFITTAVFPPKLSQKERRDVIAEHHVLCFDTADGKQLWDTVIPAGKIVTLGVNIYHGYAVPTPCTDGQHVYALFGSGVLACLDFNGKVVWREELPRLKDADAGVCSSPILYEDTVIVPGLQDKGLRALDKKTGKLKWEQNTKFRGTMATPALLRIQDKLQLIHNCQGMTLGVDPKNGDILWMCRGPASQSSPVFGSGLIYVDEGRGGRRGIAIEPTGTGDVTKTNIKWENNVEGVAGASAILVDGHVYRASGQNFIRCWSLKDGQLAHEIQAPRISPSASPIATPDGRLYFGSPGRTYVLKADAKLEVLATNDLDDGSDYTTPAVSNGRIFIKGRAYLWCIGKK